MKWMHKFLPDELNRKLLPGFAAFVIALLGFMLAIFANAIQFRSLAVAAFYITATGVLGGVVFVAYRLLSMVIGNSSMSSTAEQIDTNHENPSYPKARQPWE